MADPQPKLIYENGTGDREIWLGLAEDTSRLTLPSLDPRGQRKSRRHDRPSTTEGTTAVFSLGSQALKILMPSGVRWGELDLPPHVWNFLEQQVVSGDADFTVQDISRLRRKLEVRTFQILQSLNQRNMRSRIGAAMRRNLVEGSTAIHNAPPNPDADPAERFNRPDGIRIFPLRSHVVFRNEYGNVRVLVLKEEIDPDPISAQTKSDFEKTIEIWTLIDYENDRIWRQIGSRGDPFEVEDERVDGYFVFSSEIPDIDNYPHPYFWNYLRLIAQINHAEASMAEAMSDASWSPIGIREGSTLAEDPEAVTKKRTGEPIVHQEGDIFPVRMAAKIADWAWVAQMRNDDKRELDNVAAKGIKDRPVTEASATAVLEIKDEIDTQTQDLLSSWQDTLQMPLFASEAAIHDEIVPLLDPETDEALLKEFLQITITTGVGALSKQRAMAKFVAQILAPLKQLTADQPERFIIHAEEIADRAGEGMLIETDGLYSTLQLPAEQPPGAPGAVTANGQREETILTPGGPQPPQPVQPGAPG